MSRFDLKPCPFCGSENVKLRDIDPEFYVVSCDGCNADGGYADGADTSTPEEAVAYWNSRSPVCGWRPISDAPTTGVCIVATNPSWPEDRRVRVAWWVSEGPGLDEGCYWQDDDDSEPDPTLWQPLELFVSPAPPQGDVAGLVELRAWITATREDAERIKASIPDVYETHVLGSPGNDAYRTGYQVGMESATKDVEAILGRALAALSPTLRRTGESVFAAADNNLKGLVETGLHPATSALVDSFALALKGKLRAAELKYGHGDSWRADDWRDKCRADLLAHVHKGDPRDVAAYAAFCWAHGWSTTPALSPTLCLVDGEAEPVAWRVKDFADGWVLYSQEAGARQCATITGGLLQALYAPPPPQQAASAAARNKSEGQG